mmetsp:Transcript_4698/g.17968  ORF Transcript_4698/g.17968 Transcript_4698/m.17968 type:complete len:239 (-) Transcript_4698:2333-3049(-)
MTVPPDGAKCPQSLLGSERSVTSPVVLLTVNPSALPASLPTKVSPRPTQISPKISSASPVTGLAVCTTKANSASTSSMRSTATLRSLSSMPQDLRDNHARSVHFDAHTPQTASQSRGRSTDGESFAAASSSADSKPCGHTRRVAMISRASASAARRSSAVVAVSMAATAASSAVRVSTSSSRARSKVPNGSAYDPGTSTFAMFIAASSLAISERLLLLPPTISLLYASGVISHASEGL